MKCEQARLLIGADPRAQYEELTEHLQHCGKCLEHLRRTLAFEALLLRALATPVLVDQPDETARVAVTTTPLTYLNRHPRYAYRSRRKWGAGIGLAAALITGFILWLGRPQAAFAAQVIAHVANEPDSWSQHTRVSDAEMKSTLHAIGIERDTVLAQVVYARNCDFLGHKILHWVILTPAGPVTVMIVPHRQVRAVQTLHSGHFHALLLPLRTGSLAVSSRTDMELEELAQAIVKMLGVK